MDRFDWLRRNWFRTLKTTEGLVCELVREQSLRVAVTPLCLMRTRLAASPTPGNVFMPEVLNSSSDLIGLPRTCAGVKLASSTDDEAWPCPPLIRLPEFREFGMCLQRQPTTAGPASAPP